MSRLGYFAVLALALIVSGASAELENFEYCVIGAGPGGLQLGYYLKKYGLNYVILEKAQEAGSFFHTYPRARKLISINKRNTGSDDPEFQLRHDWNSLLSDNVTLRMTHYSKKYYPSADTLAKYLQDYADVNDLNIHYGVHVKGVARKTNVGSSVLGSYQFVAKTRRENVMLDLTDDHFYGCSVLLVAIGLGNPYVPPLRGGDGLVERYDTMSWNPEDYEGKKVMIFGNGNSAFEVADLITDHASHIHMAGKKPVRLSFLTHYVGDVRAVNNRFLDHYQLKSLDALMEVDVSKDLLISRNGSKLQLNQIPIGAPADYKPSSHKPPHKALRELYDHLIACTGWRADRSLFNWTAADSQALCREAGLSVECKPVKPSWGAKYPNVTEFYESLNEPHLFFAGALMHSRDLRRSSGGFIHGFRYLVRSLAYVLHQRYHDKSWPGEPVAPKVSAYAESILARVNSASSMYQMFGVMGDVLVLPGKKAEMSCSGQGKCGTIPAAGFHYHDVVVDQLALQEWAKTKPPRRLLTITMEYGEGFHGDKVFRHDRSVTSPAYSHLSKFLHPVLREYDFTKRKPFQVPNSTEWKVIPMSEHHILEDFLTQWDQPAHTEPLRAYLRRILRKRPAPVRDFPLSQGNEFVLPEDPTGRKHRELMRVTADDVIELARKLYALKMPEQERALLEVAYNLRAKGYGPNHPQTAISMVHLAQPETDAGHLLKALKLYRTAHNIFAKLYGLGDSKAQYASGEMRQIQQYMEYQRMQRQQQQQQGR